MPFGQQVDKCFNKAVLDLHSLAEFIRLRQKQAHGRVAVYFLQLTDSIPTALGWVPPWAPQAAVLLGSLQRRTTSYPQLRPFHCGASRKTERVTGPLGRLGYFS
eukprot:6247960-Amphidinium_carterae.1